MEMQVYKVRDPSGAIREIRGPAGASDEEVIAKAQELFGGQAEKLQAQAAKDAELYDPAAGQGAVENFAAGVGKAVYDAGRGIKQLASYVIPGMDTAAITREVIEARKRDKPLMDTGAGMTGDVVGNVGIALAPGGLLKGAAVGARAIPAAAGAADALSAAGTVAMAPRSIPAALAVGGAQGLIQPAGDARERVTNTMLGAGATAALPIATRAWGAGKAMLEPFYEGGKDQIIGRALNTAAGGKADEVVAALQNARELVPGSVPTAGQAAGNAGIASMERAAVVAVPEATVRHGERMAAQNAARVGVLEELAGTSGARQALRETRENVTKPLYERAFASSAATLDPEVRDTSLSISQYVARNGGLKANLVAGDLHPDYVNLPAGLIGAGSGKGSGIYKLQHNGPTAIEPDRMLGKLIEDGYLSPREGLREMYDLLNEEISAGVKKFMSVNDIDAALSARAAANAPSNEVLDALKKRPTFAMAVKKAGEIAADEGVSIGADPTTSIKGLHYVKLALDDILDKGAGVDSGIGKVQRRAIVGTKEQLLGELDRLSADYAAARNVYLGLSKPINQMDVAQEIADKSINKLTGTLQPQAFARALDDTTATRATGLKSATLANTMEPDQLARLTAIKEDVARAMMAQNAGRGPGSDTVQKLAYSNMIDRAGVPTFLRNFAPTQIAGNLIGRGADVAYGRANKEILQKLAMGLLDPKEAARMMQSATPSQRAEIAALLASRTLTPLGMAAPALTRASGAGASTVNQEGGAQ